MLRRAEDGGGRDGCPLVGHGRGAVAADGASTNCAPKREAEGRNHGWLLPHRPARTARRAGWPVGTIRAPGTTAVSMGVPGASARHLRRAFAIDGVTHR